MMGLSEQAGRCGRRAWFTCLMVALVSTPVGAALPELSQAREAIQSGAYGEARAYAEKALVAGLQGEALADAQHMLAMALVGQGEHRRAVEVLGHALKALKDGTAASTLADELHFQSARSLVELGDHAKAIPHFDAVIASTRSPHRQAAALGKARSLAAVAPAAKALDDKTQRAAVERALEAYEYHLSTWPGSAAARDVRLAVARLHLQLGASSRARGQLKYLVENAPRSRAGLAAKLLLNKLAPQKASLMERLASLQGVMDDRRFQEAVEPLRALRADARKHANKAVERDTLKALMQALSETRQEAEALALVPELRKLGGRLPSIETRIRWTALAGDYAGAEAMLLARHNGKKTDYYWRKLGDMRFSYGRYAEAFKAYRKARGAPKTKVVDGEKVEDLSPKMAWSLIGMGKPERALWYLKQRRPRSKRDRQGAKYWVARALQLAERREEALAGYDALAKAAPFEYYGILAHSRALEMRGKAPGHDAVAEGISALLASPAERSSAPELDAEASVSSEPAEAERPEGIDSDGAAPSDRDSAVNGSPSLDASGSIFWNASALAAKFDAAPKPKPVDKQRTALMNLVTNWGDLLPEAKRALQYWRRGLVDRARDELRVINSDLRSVRRNGAYSLLVRGRNDLLDNRRVGAARGGAKVSAGKRQRPNKSAWTIAKKRKAIRTDLRAAQVSLADPYALRRQAFETRRVPKTDADLSLWKRVYPVAFPELVSTFSDLHGVPPYFLYGIMTVESTFHPGAVSVANAYGLLQVIPRTGRRIALDLGYTEFVPDLLLKPEMSIYFGSYYLGALLKKYRGQELLAAAAYNCGPHRVDRWLRQNPNRDMDLFIEQIPYGQTKGYARSVLEKVARYRRTYHGEETVYISNRLATDSALQPNY